MKPAAYVRVCGIDIPVFLGTAQDNDDLVDAWGCYSVTEMSIWLDKSCPGNLIDEVLTHEVIHALIHRSGMLYELCAVFGLHRGDPKFDAWEEALVRRLTPHIVETFGPVRAIPVEQKAKKPRTKGVSAPQARSKGRSSGDFRR